MIYNYDILGRNTRIHYPYCRYTYVHKLTQHSYFLICFHKFEGFFLTLLVSSIKILIGKMLLQCLHTLQATGKLPPQLELASF